MELLLDELRVFKRADLDLVDRDAGHPSDDTDLMNTGMKCQRKNPRMPMIASTTQTGGSLCAIY